MDEWLPLAQFSKRRLCQRAQVLSSFVFRRPTPSTLRQQCVLITRQTHVLTMKAIFDAFVFATATVSPLHSCIDTRSIMLIQDVQFWLQEDEFDLPLKSAS